jgi:hypothetical protein
MINLANEPFWKEWKQSQIARTLYFDEPFQLPLGRLDGDFVLSPELAKQHAVVIQNLGLQQTVFSLSERMRILLHKIPFSRTAP